MVISGLTQPAKVIGFLDVFDAWDATLLIVMVGAIAVHGPLYWFIRKRATPVFAPAFALPTRRDIDLRLIAGAAIFGVGWGIGGYCPGPGLTALASGRLGPLMLVVGLAVGWFVTAKLEAMQRGSTEGPARASAHM